MPQHRSAAKRIRSDAKKRLRNRIVRTQIKSEVRRFREAPDGETAKGILSGVYRVLDRAAKRGILPARRVARRKSRLAKEAARRA